MVDQMFWESAAQPMLFVLALAFLASPICSAVVASTKGRDPVSWFFVGLIFGPLGLIAAAGVGPRDRQAERARFGGVSTKQICAACDEAVSANAVVCRYCRADLR